MKSHVRRLMRLSLALFFALSSLLVACEAETGAPAAAATEAPREELAVGGDVLRVDPSFLELMEQQRVIQPALIERLMVLPQDATPLTLETAPLEAAPLTGILSYAGPLTFEASVADVAALAVNDVIVSDSTDQAPFGLLQRVTAIDIAGDRALVMTEQAFLEDVIENGVIVDQATLVPEPGTSGVLSRGTGWARVLPGPGQAAFSIKVDHVLHDADGDETSKNDQIVAHGLITLEPKYEFGVVIQGFKIKKVLFKNRTSVHSELELEAKVDILNLKKEVEVYRHQFPPHTVWVGALPVVLTPVLVVNVGLQGQVSVGISTGFTHDILLDAHVGYETGDWIPPVIDLTSTFAYDAPALKNRARAKLYAGPQLELLIFGAGGPYASLQGYFELDVDPGGAPWWTLYRGIDGVIGVKAKLFKVFKLDYSHPLLHARELVAQADTGGAQPQHQVAYDFLERAHTAHWNSDAGTLPWPGGETDKAGFAMLRTDVRLEDGSSAPTVLETHPQWVDGGRIGGTYIDAFNSGYIVGPGDVFRAQVGLMENAFAGEATFRVMIRPDGGPNEWIAEVTDSYDGALKMLEVDLSPWAGKPADFILQVEAGATSAQDWATWVFARVER